MAWRRKGTKPLAEPMMPYFTDTYMRHSASMSLTHWPLGDLGVISKIQISILFYRLVSSEHLMIMPSDQWQSILLITVNNGSGNGLLMLGIKPLPEPMFTQIPVATRRH